MTRRDAYSINTACFDYIIYIDYFLHGTDSLALALLPYSCQAHASPCDPTNGGLESASEYGPTP